MVVLYDKTAISFNSLGLGTLTDFLELPLVTEALNGEYYVEFQYLKGGKNDKYLLEDNLIKVLGQVFRIEDVEPTIEGIRVLARHIAFDLRNNFIEDLYPRNLTAQSALEWILERAFFSTRFYVTGSCTKVANARYQKLSIYDALYTSDNAILKRFGGEIEFDNYHIILHKKRGSETNLEIREKKNLKGIEIKKDYSTIKTRLMPVGSNGIVLPEKYIDSPYINSYFEPKIGKLTINTDTEKTIEEQYIEMRNATNEAYENGMDLPSISIKVDFIELSKTKEYERFKSLQVAHLGDIVRVYVPSLHTNLKVRIIKVIKNGLTGEIEKLELGSEMTNIVSSISKNSQILREEIHESANISLETFRKEATEMLNHPFGGHLYISEETGEIFIMDTKDVSTSQKIWKWGLGGLGFSDVGINGPYKTAWTQDGKFNADFIATGKLNTNLIEGYENLVLKLNNLSDTSAAVTQLEIDLKRIEGKISDSFDLTVFVKGENVISLDNVATSEPIMFLVHPTIEDISYLYLKDSTYLTDNTYLFSRTIIFENKTTKKTVEYELPTDLLVLDGTYDEFVLNNSSRECKVIKRVGINTSGEKYILSVPQTKIFSFPTIALEEGNYTVRMLNSKSAYFEFRAITVNPYSDQFVAQVTYESNRIQTEKYISDSLKLKVDATVFETYRKQTATLIEDMVKNTDFESFRTQTAGEFKQTVKSGEIISSINQSHESIGINANKINITANDILNIISNNEINLKSRNISIISDNFSVDKNGNAKMKNADFSGKITSTSGTIANWTITTGKIYGGDSTTGVAVMQIPSANTTWVFAAGGKSHDAYADCPFRVSKNGEMYATSGKIAEFTINGAMLVGTNVGVSGKAGQGYAFWAGSNTASNAPFRVGHDGSLRATNADISGKINATSGSFTGTITSTSGTIGGWSISTDGLKAGNSSLLSNGNLNLYPSVGGVYRINNGVRLNATSGVQISSNGGSPSFPSKDLNLLGLNGASAYMACRWGDSGSERSAVTCADGTLYLSSVGAIYANGVAIGGSSSIATKENIYDLTQEKKDEIYNLLKNIPLKEYDYKEQYGYKKNYGFLIEDIENTKLKELLHIVQNKENTDIKVYSSEDLVRLILIVIQEIMKKIER